ncbi:MAG: helix-turn-helix transcriptional regulator [[Pasteurella] mairii]|uniref:Antitoxin HicB n=1 Tax=[Pasteurella] mairii TaxID=757 RepID=A0A379B4T4_9PAST|nr:helix-turn-helix transcriptional regulator [[Pasteurella] mairii]SUB33617.1 Antitoxin HicB [[Pasteurella] mairii]
MAADALITAMEFYFEDHRTVPLPSNAEKEEVLIELLDSIFAKVLLLNEMISQNISNAEFARRIDVKPQEVQRITNLGHNTKIDTISRALSALGKQLQLSVV